MYVPAKELQDGDSIVQSSRYGYKIRGEVKIASANANLVFLSKPTLADEDVAFKIGEQVLIDRTVPA